MNEGSLLDILVGGVNLTSPRTRRKQTKSRVVGEELCICMSNAHFAVRILYYIPQIHNIWKNIKISNIFTLQN